VLTLLVTVTHKPGNAASVIASRTWLMVATPAETLHRSL
jgi:hypothetical protein